MPSLHDSRGNRNGQPRISVPLVGFLAIAVFFLVTEHRAHAFGYLPLILLLLCPLLHLFMHGGHGGHGGTGDPGSGAGGPHAGHGRGLPSPQEEARR